MPKLPVLSSSDVIRILERKGFIFDRIKGSHHIYFKPDTLRRVVIPHHKKDLPKGTLHEILKQAGLTSEDIKESP